MSVLDPRGVAVSYSNPDALASFERALLAFQSYFGDSVAELKPVLAEHPDFALAHLLRAFALIGASERRFVQAARRSIAAAEALIDVMNDRERALLTAAQALADGEWTQGCATLDRLLIDWPTDALAIQVAHLTDFLRGDALNLRNRIARVLPHWHSDLPGYGYLLSMHAFGLEECNDYARAEAQADTALAINPRDVWGVHAKVHVLEMQGRVDEGIRFLESREADWSPDNNFALHNWWHLCLFYFDRGDIDRILEIFDTHLRDNAEDISMALVDLTALLWRLRLLDHDVGDRLANVASIWRDKIDSEAGHYAFNDYHAAMAFADVRDLDALATLRAGIVSASQSASSDFGAMNERVGLPLIDAWTAWAQGQYEEAADHFAGVRDIAMLSGGSHAQRDVITLSLIESARRAGDHRRARHFLADRLTATPGSGLASHMLERIAG